MQERLQKQMAELRVEATAGGGMVTVVVNGVEAAAVVEDRSRGRREGRRRDAAGSDRAAVNDAQRKADEADGADDGRHDGGPADSRPMSLPDPLLRLIEELQRLPGIGPKGAQRLAFHLLKTPREHTDRLVEAVRDVKERVTYCSVCNNITDADPCVYCRNDARDHRLICVVEEPQNVAAIEKTREFKGVYHVLMGALSPLQGIGPDELKIKGLLSAPPAGSPK